MNIGVIGVGDIGEVIVKKLRDAGYPVKMANSRGPDSLGKLVAETGAQPVSVEEVVQDVDVLFIVLPQRAIPGLPKGLLNRAKKETIVIDHIDEIESGLTDSAMLATITPFATRRRNISGRGTRCELCRHCKHPTGCDCESGVRPAALPL